MTPNRWILLAFALALALITAWFMIPAPPPIETEAEAATTAPAQERPTPVAPMFPDSSRPTTPGSTPTDPGAAARQATGADEKIAAILLDESIEHDEAVARLFAILPTLPADHQEETAHHIANLSSDEAAQTWARQIVENKLPEPAATVLFDELMNRPHEILMPALADMADRDNHPKREDSTEILEILFGPPEPEGKKWQDWVKEQIAAEEADGR